MIQSILEYFRKCPFLENGYINVDYLGTERQQYSIEMMPSDKYFKRYVDGGGIRQKVFHFKMSQYYGADVDPNLANAQFSEDLIEWVEENSEKELYPISEEMVVNNLEALSAGYLETAEESRGVYVIQFRVLYEKRGGL